MPRLNAANNANSTLSSAIDSTQTTIDVVDASEFPAVPFRLTIDDEIMEVSAVSGNTFTVERGLENTTATSHKSGTKVENNYTAGTHKELADKAEVQSLQTNLNEHKADYMPHDSELNQYLSGKDSDGIYTVTDFERPDGTLYLKSTLSNTDANGNYRTVTWDFYDESGNLDVTKTWSLSYDQDGKIESKVIT
ncbi:hypothetical protein ACW2QC_09410 [Virgibacillus sp. FSP13]